jgi:hypothetical protein
MNWKMVAVICICIVIVAPLGFWAISSILAASAIRSVATGIAQETKSSVAPEKTGDRCSVVHVTRVHPLVIKAVFQGMKDQVTTSIQSVTLSDGREYRPDAVYGASSAEWYVGATKDLCEHVDSYDRTHSFYTKSEKYPDGAPIERVTVR